MDYLHHLIAAVVLISLFGYFALYSNKIIKKFTESQSIVAKIYYKLFGRHIGSMNIKVTRAAKLNKKSFLYKVYVFFEDIIINLDMKKDNVTVMGIILFMTSLSVVIGLIIGYIMGSIMIVITGSMAVFYLILTIFRMSALIKYEKREAEVMDAVDLLVSDVGGGVYNAIIRYQDSFHPNIKQDFVEFIDDIQNKGYSFKQAMLNLNNRIGHNFTDFTTKAIHYEDKADDTLEDIFSSIIETNRQRRTLRYINNIEFAALRTQFIVSLILIGMYGVFSILVDPYIKNFLLHTTGGKIMIITDIVIVAWVLSYLTSIKSKSL